MKDRKKVVAALAAVQLYLEEEERARAPWKPPSLWRIYGRREQMRSRSTSQVWGPQQS